MEPINLIRESPDLKIVIPAEDTNRSSTQGRKISTKKSQPLSTKAVTKLDVYILLFNILAFNWHFNKAIPFSNRTGFGIPDSINKNNIILCGEGHQGLGLCGDCIVFDA